MTPRLHTVLSLACVTLAAAACGGPAAGPLTGTSPNAPGGTAPMPTLADVTTAVIPFQAASIPIDPNQPIVPATCRASARVPRAGAYACASEAGGQFDPCFEIQSGQLGCQPNPAFQSWSAIVTVTGPLPETSNAVPQPMAIVLDLGFNYPPCNAGTTAPKELGGQPVTFSCQAPGAWLVGPLDSAGERWIAQYVTTDSQGQTVTSGPTAVAVARAWMY